MFELVVLLASLFAAAFARESFLDAFLLAGLQVEGVTLDLLNDVPLLHFALKRSEGILEGLTLLNPNFSQTNYTPKLVPLDAFSYCKVRDASQ